MAKKLLRRKSIYNAEQSVEFISTGCKVLDLVLGGGYPLGRCTNIVGDKSTGKTLLAIEAIANFHRHFEGECSIMYNETEAAFDESYARSLGIPMEAVTMITDCATVEDLYDSIAKTIEASKKDDTPVLYIIDSLDALSDDAEMGRGIREGSYGMGKQKKLSEIFRRLVRAMSDSKMLFIVISQTRTKIGVTFGSKVSRSGGKALDFYASQIVYLHYKGRIVKTIDKAKREIGVDVRAKCEKNKVGRPLRQCEFPILFGFGIDDVRANLKWLEENHRLEDAGYKAPAREVRRFREMSASDRRAYRSNLEEQIQTQWDFVEAKFDPDSRKYD